MSDIPFLENLENYRYNGFTNLITPKLIGYGTNPTEDRTIPSSAPYIILLHESPQFNIPSTTSIYDNTDGVWLLEVSKTTTPANRQFRVNYDERGNGQVEFNANQKSHSIKCYYYGEGANAKIETLFSTSIYNNIIGTQAQFNSIIERTAANTYQIKDNIKSVYFKELAGGFLMHGPTSPLAGGDTWGIIETNDCAFLDAEIGSYINFYDTQGYIKVNTEGCILNNIDVRGDFTTAVTGYCSFLLDASYVRYKNCKTSNRYSSSVFYAFRGNPAIGSLNNITVKYDNCIIQNIKSTNVQCGAFHNGVNIENAFINNISSDSSNVSVYNTCRYITNCLAYNITAGAVAFGYYSVYVVQNSAIVTIESLAGNCYGGYDVYQFSNCVLLDLEATGGNTYGYSTGDGFTSCYINNIRASGANGVYGFAILEIITGCLVVNMDHTGTGEAMGYRVIEQLSASEVLDCTHSSSGQLIGFSLCFNVSACKAEGLDHTGSGIVSGFDDNDAISACKAYNLSANSGNAYGFTNNYYFSACYAVNITSVTGSAQGWTSNTYGTAIGSTTGTNSGNDYICTTDAQIVNKVATPSIFT